MAKPSRCQLFLILTCLSLMKRRLLLHISSDCSQSPIFPWDFRDSCASIELPPSWFVTASATWGVSKLPRGAGVGRRCFFSLLLPPTQCTLTRPPSVVWALAKGFARLYKPRWRQFDRKSHGKIGDFEQSKIPYEERRERTPTAGVFAIVS